MQLLAFLAVCIVVPCAGAPESYSDIADVNRRFAEIVANRPFLGAAGAWTAASTSPSIVSKQGSKTSEHVTSQGVTPSWVARFGTGSLSSIDAVGAVAVDKDGSVYAVAGGEYPGTSFDIVTIKYDADGAEAWRRRYGGSAEGNDLPFGMAVDGRGAVYVLGAATRLGTFADIVLIKYTVDGALDWVREYDGPAHGFDVPSDLVLGANGSVYVAGLSQRSGWAEDFAGLLLQYDPDGELVWEARYDETTTEFYDIALDAEGGLYVTGTTVRLVPGESWASYDVLTARYDAEARLRWARMHEGAAHNTDRGLRVAVDDEGNVYMAAEVFETLDPKAYVIQYDPEGELVWSDSYAGRFNTGEVVVRIVSTNDGAVLCGYSSSANEGWFFVRYGRDGRRMWTVHESVAAYLAECVLDQSGGFFAVGYDFNSGSLWDVVTARYDLVDGTAQWADRYDGPEGDEDVGYAAALNPAGDLVVAGRTFTDATDFDALLLRYAQAGGLEWMAAFGGVGEANDLPRDSFMDADGHLYVSGLSERELGMSDMFTVKITPDGEVAWHVVQAQDQFSEAYAVTADVSGNVYVTGTQGVGAHPDWSRGIRTLKYDPTGQLLWQALYVSNGPVDGRDVAANADGDVFVGGGGFTTVKYASNGTQRWARDLDDGEISFVFPYPDGGVVVVGTSVHTITAARYGTDGERLWVYRHTPGLYDWPPGSSIAHDAAMASDGSLVITGEFFSENRLKDWITLRISSAGAVLWEDRYGRPDWEDVAGGLVLDPLDGAYVAGTSYWPVDCCGGDPGTIRKYSFNGSVLWTTTVEASVLPPFGSRMGPNLEWGPFIDRADDGSIYSTWAVSSLWSETDMATFRHSPDGEKIWEARYAGVKSFEERPVGVHAAADGSVTAVGFEGFLNFGWQRSLVTAIRYISTTNRPPVITSTPGTASVGQPFTYQVTAEDPDGDPLFFGFERGMAWMDLDPQTGLITGMPVAQHGDGYGVTVSLYANDGRGGVAHQRFTLQVVVPTSSEQPPAPSYGLIAPYPNPVAGVLRLGYDLAQPGSVRLRVLNATGQHISTIEDGYREAGHHDVAWDVGGLAAGLYVLIMEANSYTASRTFIVQ